MFSHGFDNMTTVFQGPPSDTVDKAWSDLYNGTNSFSLCGCSTWSNRCHSDFGISEVSEEEAKPLFNQTVARPNGKYLVGLAVFHELHCLVGWPSMFCLQPYLLNLLQNIIRKALRPDYYTDPLSGAIGGIQPKKLEEHISHCIDDLRQSAMCASDIRSVSPFSL